MSFDFFGNVYLPTACIYNIVAESGSVCQGTAIVEQWTIQDKVLQIYSEYAQDARRRCSNSD